MSGPRRLTDRPPDPVARRPATEAPWDLVRDEIRKERRKERDEGAECRVGAGTAVERGLLPCRLYDCPDCARWAAASDCCVGFGVTSHRREDGS